MAKRLKAMGQPKYQTDGDPSTSGPGFGVSCHPAELERPLRWRPSMVFVNSMSDLFHPNIVAEPDWLREVFTVMGATPRHTYQVLTKRPQLMADWIKETALVSRDSWPFPNVWLGTSIESDRYTFRADYLRATPAVIRFLSLEPLLGPLPTLDLTGIDWVIIGAESGRGARPMNLDWARHIRDHCRAAGVPLFIKQLTGGTHPVKDLDRFPNDLQIREWPLAPPTTGRSPRKAR